MRIVVALVVAALGLAACGDDADSGVGDSPASSLDAEGAWQLESGTGIREVSGYRITLTLAGSQVGGTAACNGYGGTITISGEAVTIGELSWTEMACEPAVMDAEQAFLSALTAVNTMARDGDRLVLTGPGTELRFVALAPVAAAELFGTTWVLDTLIDGDTASTAGGERATLTLGEDGTIDGSTGCRTLTGSFVVTGDEIVATGLRADGECRPDLARQDDLVVSVLGDGFRADVDGDRLTLTSQGNDGLGYRAG